MKNKLFKTFTGLAGIYHIILGGIALIFPLESISNFIQLALSFTPTVNPEMVLVSKFAGVYLLVFGIVCLILANNPTKYRVLLIPVLTLFGIRLVNKIFFFDLISETFVVPIERSIFAILSIALFFLVILLSAPKK